MQATDILMEEHRVIERVIASIENAVTRMQNGEAGEATFFLQAAEFIKGFADGCHHQKEENVLFKKIVENGVPLEGGPVAVMLYEHEQGRRYTRAMRAAAEAWKAGDASQRPVVMENALAYAALLRGHIYKENHILFPLANRVIPLEEQDAVNEGFEHIEHEETGEGIHEKYLALAEALETA